MMDGSAAPRDTTFVDLAFTGVWRVRTRGGEFLDVDLGTDGGAPQLVSAPISRLRHGFRIRSVEEPTEVDRWAVWAEPVPLDDLSQEAQDGGGVIFPFVLVYDGCDRFSLEALPDDHALNGVGGLTAQEALDAVAELATGQADALPVAMDAFTFLNTASTVGFPEFTGDMQRAFTHIGVRLGFDPHSTLLTLAALSNVTRPVDIPQRAWDVVVRQLRIEIDYRELVRGYFGSVESFVQTVFIGNAGMVDNVGALVQLDADDVVQLVLHGAMQAVAGAVGSVPVPGSGVVSGALSVLFEQMAKDKGPGIGDFSVALCDARRAMTDLFDAMITIVQKWRTDVLHDWGKLRTMGQNLKSGQVAWPDDDEPMRKAARRELEISLFKDLLKVRWNHMRASDDPTFHPRNDWIPGYLQRNRHYWVVAVPATEHDLFGKEKEGYSVTMHWLGRGSTIFDHRSPDDRLCHRIFDELGIARETVFTQWGLTPQTFYVSKGG